MKNKISHLFNRFISIVEENADFEIPGDEMEDMLVPYYEKKSDVSSPMDFLINYNEIFKGSHLILFRNEVIQQIFSCLIGKYKPNALLIGAAGVGKTRIVENIAKMLEDDFPLIPPQLKGYTIWELPLSALISGSGVVGDVEKKTKQVIDFASDIGNKAILFIDEMHMLMCGDKQYNIVAQVLKSALARGSIRVIGATTLQETNDFMRDPAFSRRFNRIVVDELTKEQTIYLLKDMRSELTEHYNGKIILGRKVIEETVEIADRYRLSGSHRPDNAITLLDRAMAEIFVSECYSKRNQIHLTPKHIKNTALTLTTGRIINDKTDIDSLRSQLSVIKGQDDVLENIIDCIKRESLDIFPHTKPLTMLFAGSSGTGKTETATLIAKELTGSPPITLNMTEFAEKSSLSRIVGVHAGYTGSDSKAELPFDILDSNPRQVILLDEFEKCHRSVQKLFMQVFDTGFMQLANNKAINFSQALIIATTNAGCNSASSSIGFTCEYRSSVNSVKELSAGFDIALLNRFTKILYFHSISEEIFREIIRNKYSREVSEIKQHRKISYILPDTLPDDAVDMLVSKSYNPAFGARPATRVVREYIENILVDDHY